MNADEWLKANDPQYESQRKNWKHLSRSGSYYTPRQEVPVGLASDLALLVSTGKGQYAQAIERRICERCHQPYVPKNSWHRFCSERCNNAAAQQRWRDRKGILLDK